MRRVFLLPMVSLLVLMQLAAQPVISEFVAANEASLLDGDGQSSDWIEIYNGGPPIDLVGWHMTDNPGDLTKWQVASSLPLGAGDFAVVFASGRSSQPYVDALGYHHANFRIDLSGEYLALVAPDGTNVVSVFTNVPAQVTDHAFGLVWDPASGTSNLLEHATITALVPTNGLLGSTWTSIAFNDPAWSNAPGPGIGFDLDSTNASAALVASWNFDDAAGAGMIASQTGSFAGVPNGGVTPGGIGANAETGTSIAFASGGIDIPNDPALNPDNFTFAAWVRVASGGSGHRAVVTSRQDDGTVRGYILYVTPGNIWSFWTGAGGPAGSWNTLNGPAVVLDTWQHLAISWDAATATKAMYVDGSVSVSTTSQGYTPNLIRETHLGSGNDFGTQFRFFGSIDEPVLWSEAVSVTVLQEHMAKGNAAFTAVSFHPLIDLDLEGRLHQQAPGVYVRHAFQLPDASVFDHVTLDVHYDDGFAAYLNETLIASRNAPVNPVFDDVATVLREDEQALDVEQIDVSQHLAVLQDGDNVLAIHALNRDAAEPDMLIRSQLSGTILGAPSTSQNYLLPTPGAMNPNAAVQPGPLIHPPEHLPVFPEITDSLVLTVRIDPRLAPVQSASVIVRLNYAAETPVVLSDDGVGPDLAAGDGLYTADLSTVLSGASPRDLLRYRVEATDAQGGTSRSPAYLDNTGKNQAAEYHGTLVVDPGFTSTLPALFWYTDDVPNSETRTGARASVIFNGRFYDNIFVRERGGFTSHGSQKFDFNKGDSVYVNEKLGKVGELNLNAPGADNTYVRQPLAFQLYEVAEAPAPDSFNVLLVRNGAIQRVAHLIEQVDEDFLDRQGLDRDGALYKFVQRSNLNPVFNDTITGVEKKTRTEEDFSDLDDFIDAIRNGSTAQRRRALFDRVDLPRFTNFMAAKMIVRDVDSIRKNFYGYRDTLGSGEWTLFPWDEDFSFGNTNPGAFANHIFLGDEGHKLACCDQWNVLYDLYNQTPYTRDMFLRRLRTLMDEMIQPPGTPPDGSIIEQRADMILATTQPHTGTNVNSIKSWVSSWRNNLYGNFGPGGIEPLIPAAQPVQPDIRFGTIEARPPMDQDAEYIELVNHSTHSVDLSHWSITGGVAMIFVPGTVLPANTNLFVSPNRAVFRARASSPTGDEGRLVVGDYSGHLNSFGETLYLVDASGQPMDTLSFAADPSDAQRYLVLSELMYHPVSMDAEYVELLNISDTVSLQLDGMAFTAGVHVTLPAHLLGPGERVLLVKDMATFTNIFGGGLPVIGTFSPDTRLANEGDRIKFEDADGNTVQDFSYDEQAPWPDARGNGLALHLLGPFTRPDHDEAYNWYADAPGPGLANGSVLVGDPLEDFDGDDQVALLEHALGGDDHQAQVQAAGIIHRDIATHQVLSYVVNTAAEDVEVILQHAASLAGPWLDAPAFLTFDGIDPAGPMRGQVRWRFTGAAGRLGYLRLKIVQASP